MNSEKFGGMFGMNNDKDPFDTIPRWAFFVIIVGFALSLCAIAKGQEADDFGIKQGGGVEVKVADDGTPRFVVDIASIDWKAVSKKKWYAKPVEFTRQIGSNTAANVKANPWAWITSGAVAGLLVSGEAERIAEKAQKLLGGGSDDKSDNQQQSATKPATINPGLYVEGQNNTVTAPASEIDGPVIVSGNNNNVHLTEPETTPATGGLVP